MLRSPRSPTAQLGGLLGKARRLTGTSQWRTKLVAMGLDEKTADDLNMAGIADTLYKRLTITGTIADSDLQELPMA